MSNNATSGFGMILEYESSPNSDTWVAVAEIYNAGGLKMSRSDIDATTHESPDGWKESRPGLKEPGDYTFEAHMLNSDPQFIADFAAGTMRQWRTKTPHSPPKVRVFPGYVKNIEEDTPIDDRMVFKVTLKISGKPTL